MRILLSISIFLIGLSAFASVVVLDQSGQGDYTTFTDAFNNSTTGDTIYVVGSAASYGNVTINSPRVIIGNGFFGQSLGYQPSATFGSVTINAGAASSQLIGITTNSISFSESNISFVSCFISGNTTIGASITDISFEKSYFSATLTVQGSGVSISNSIFNISSTANALTVTGGVEAQLSYVTFYDGNLSLDTATVNNCIVNADLVTQTPAVILDGQFGNKVDVGSALLFSTDKSGDQFFQLQAGSSALTSSEESGESGAFGFEAGQSVQAYVFSGLPSIPQITGLNYSTASNSSSNLEIGVKANSDLVINQISISIFQEGSEVDVQNFSGFTASTTIDEVVSLSTSAFSLGMHNFSAEVVNANGVRSILVSGSFLQEESIVANANITEIEYFFDSEPGEGLGTQVDVTLSSEISIPTQSLNTAGLSEGFHNLYLRAKDETGKWGTYTSQTIYIESSVGVGDVVVIDRLEYFVDTDPGVGLGTPIIGSGSDVSLVESLDLSGLSVGFHNIYLRGKLANGSWGPYTTTTVYVESTVGLADVVVIDQLEYFIDTDPGEGAGIPISIAQGQDVTVPMESINTTELSLGFHTLYLRGKLENGAWGPYTSQSIYIEANTQGGSEDIVALEYFFDADPGVGEGLVTTGSTPAAALNETVSLSASSLSPGTHTVHFRAQEESGLWSHYQTQTIEVLSGALVESIADGNWDDPSVWSSSVVPTGSDSVVVKNSISLNVATDTVLALTLSATGSFDLNGNDIHVVGRFSALSGNTYLPNGGTLYMDGGSQTYSQEGDISHDNLIFGGTGTKIIDYLASDNMSISDSLHIETGVSLSFTNGGGLSMIGSSDFINNGSISSTERWSLFLNGTSHSISGGDFNNVTFQKAVTLNLESNFNYEGDFTSGGFASTVNLGTNAINLGSDWTFEAADILNFDVGGRFEVNKTVNFSMVADVPLTMVSIPSGSFDVTNSLIFAENQLLNISSGDVNLNSANFSGTGGINLTGGTLTVIDSELTFGSGSVFANDGGSISITGTSSIKGATTSDAYTMLNSSGSILLNGTAISEIGGLGISLLGGTASLTDVTFTNGLGVSYITFGEGYDGVTYDGIIFESGPTANVTINDGIDQIITFDNYGGSFGGPDFDNPGSLGTINWTNPQGVGTITVSTPSGGEELNVGQVFQITWTTENVPDEDLIEINLSTDGGGSYSLIGDGTFATYNGAFDWTVPDQVGADNVIQVVNTTQGISDESEGLFSIVQSGGDPVANEATNVTSVSFTASWSNVGGDNYLVDVSTVSDFATFVDGKEGLESTDTFLEIQGLDFKQKYFYRVTADQQGTLSDFSNTVSVVTTIDSETEADSSALIQIYNDLVGSSWSTPVNWETARLRDWDRVSLDDNRTRVESVDISNVGAIGAMSHPFEGEATGGLSALTEMNLSDNQITGLMDFSGTAIADLNVSGNILEFDDLEPVASISTLDYTNQASVQFVEASVDPTEIRYTNNYSLSTIVGGSSNQYLWYRNESAEVLITGADFSVNGASLDIIGINYDNMGSFRVEVTNELVPGLTIDVDPQLVYAIADMTVEVRNSDGVLIPETLDGYLMETTQLPTGFDTLEIVNDVSSTFIFPDVVLGNYIMAAASDPEKYIPSYYAKDPDVVEWDKADTVFFRTDEAIQLQMTDVPEDFKEGDGDGTLDVLMEEDFGESEGRIDARRRAAKRKCGLRRKRTGGRTTDDEFELVAYGETDENGEFQFDFLPSGIYRFFVEYPGIPLDEAAFVEFEVGEAGISNTDFKLEAFASENGIEVTIDVVLGVILDYFKDLQIYPNPSSENLNISYRHLKSRDVVAELVDLSGNTKWSQDLNSGFNGNLRIDVSAFEHGVYLLRFYDRTSRNENVVTYRVMVMD
ncbi:MAG: T9SS type A sorting domain-containing protein [Ekhidna sp.]